MSFFFDTNILVYVFDRSESVKQVQAQDLVTAHMTARDMVLSTQVLQELYVTLTRKKQLGAADALEVVTTFAQERVVPASADLVLRGLALSRRSEAPMKLRSAGGSNSRLHGTDAQLLRSGASHSSQISVWDALIVQSALDAGCTTLYSEDFQNGMRFDDLVVVNPFVLQAHEPPSKLRMRPGKR